MKNILIIILLAVRTIVSATDYYISTSGNDLNNGLSSSTPWKTINKVNSKFPSLLTGDKILFNRGNIFYGTLNITKSGSAGSPIIISAYGTGANPVLTGFTTISGWTNTGGGIYSKNISCESSPNMVTVNGINTPMGRYPDAGWLSIDSHSTNSSITDAALPSTPDWDGAEVVIRKNHWIIDRNAINNHSGNTIYYSSASSYDARDGYGYFVQKDLETLTTLGEWYYNTATSTFYMYFGASNPVNYVVKVSTIDELSNIFNSDYITFENLTFEGSNKSGFDLQRSSNVTINNCEIGYSGSYGLWGATNYGENSNYLIINNSIIKECNNSAIVFDSEIINALISNNSIYDIGKVPGMGGSRDGANYSGVFIANAQGTIVEYNKIYNIGYIPVTVNGNNTKIRNNYIYNYCFVKDDGGGIYSTSSKYTGREITNNIVLYGIGAGNGTTGVGSAQGIYLDDRSSNVIVRGNTVAFQAWAGIYLHNSPNSNVRDNVSFCNNKCQLLVVGDNLAADTPMRNITLKNNILISKTSSQYTLIANSLTNDFNRFGILDSNFYARPVDETKTLSVYINWVGGTKTLSEWKSFSGQDPNSQISPFTFTDTSKIQLYFNPTKSDKVFTLNLPMVDVKGVKYNSNISLLPFKSAILMVDPNPVAPSVPVFTGAVINNATPGILEISYNLTLANIVPVASAFSVQVNSVSRTVNSVTISGNKVLLTLSSPVVSGNTVTVAYTKPSTNPLQTANGGQAVTFSAQTVTINTGTPTYISSVVENGTPSVLEMTFSLSLANIVPANSAFTVMVNSVARTVNSVTISGTKVLLTLSSPVVYGNIVTVAYTRPSTNPLQTTLGGQAVTISAKTVTNNTVTGNIEIPVYRYSTVLNTSPSILGITYYLTLANVVPAASAFTVKVNSVARTVNSVSISGNLIQLTLSSPVSYGNIVTVSYTKPSTNPIQTSQGGQAISFSDKPVTNYIGIPSYSHSTIENVTPSILGMNYNLTLANVIPAASAFTVMVNSVARTVNTVTVSGTRVLLTLSSPVVYGNIVTVTYIKPTTNQLQTTIGGQAETINARTVNNNCLSGYKSMVTFSNDPPVPDLNYDTTAISGNANEIVTENISIYPNPASEFINVSIIEPCAKPQFLRIFDFSGRLCLESMLEPDTNDIKVSINLKSGSYIVQVLQGTLTVFTQKLIVI